jgi:hypothetical protein
MKKNNLARILGITAGLGILFLSNKSLADELEIQNVSWTSGVGSSIMNIEHDSGAQESGPDGFDSEWQYEPQNPNTKWLKIATNIYGEDLIRDARPLTSETIFNAKLGAVDNVVGGVTSTNSLQFNFLIKDADFSNRVYTAKIHCDGTYTPSGNPFDWTGNITNNMTVGLPGITNVPNGTVYGTVDVSCRFLTNAIPTSISKNGTNATLEAKVQPGATATPQYRGDLTSGTWSNLDSFAQYANVDSNNFNSTPYSYTDPNNSNTYNNASSMTFSNLPALGDKGFYRLKTSN